MLEAASALGWGADEVQEFDERTGGPGRRLMDFVERHAPHLALAENSLGAFAMSYADASKQLLTAGDRYIEALRTVLNALADEGDVVVGRGGQAMLAHHPNTVQVRVACAPDERARRVARRDQLDIETARCRVAESDRQREDWHRKYLSIDYQAPYHYGLVVNTGIFSDAFAAQLIVGLVRTHVRRAPTDSQMTRGNRPLRVLSEAASMPS
jgi:cytidylate kinase